MAPREGVSSQKLYGPRALVVTSAPLPCNAQRTLGAASYPFVVLKGPAEI